MTSTSHMYLAIPLIVSLFLLVSTIVCTTETIERKRIHRAYAKYCSQIKTAIAPIQKMQNGSKISSIRICKTVFLGTSITPLPNRISQKWCSWSSIVAVAYLALNLSKGRLVLNKIGLKQPCSNMYSNLMKRYWKNQLRVMPKNTYEEGIGSKVEFAFTDLEPLQNWADFVSKVLKFANVGVARTTDDFDVSCFVDIIYDIIQHVAAKFCAPVHFQRQHHNGKYAEQWHQEVSFEDVLSHEGDRGDAGSFFSLVEIYKGSLGPRKSPDSLFLDKWFVLSKSYKHALLPFGPFVRARSD